jgi:5-enolpyruvylshikimate-3-phosphate synthase
MSRRVADRAVAFVTEQSLAVVGEEHLPGSTECLESLIGKGKRLEGQQSRSGFTKMVLGMAASVAEPTVEYVRTALEQVKTRNVTAWCKEKLGVSVQAQRRQALPPLLDGIKTG